VSPAVRGARPANRLQAYIFEVCGPIYVATAGSRAIYRSTGDHGLPRAGELLRQPELADTFETLAREGPGLIYGGELGRRLAAACAAEGGQLTLEDLERYRVIKRRALARDFRDARVYTNPPPSRGGILIAFALALLDRLPAGDRTRWLQDLAAAMRFSNLARAESDDRLLEPDLLERYRAELSGRPGCDRGTTHISVVDGEGNFAAASLSNGEGCGHVLSGTGIMLNNMLGEEDLNPGGFQRWAPGTRMASMMASTLVEHRGGQAVLGSGGSNRIRSAILQVVANLVDFDMTPADAVQAPRIHVEGERLSVEGGFSDSEQRALEATGLAIERWRDRNLFFGGVHVVQRTEAGLSAFGDPRRGGVGRLVEAGPP